jgi:tetratricopeptide (TPR) repeat protein
MRPYLRIAAVIAALLFFTSTSHAQFYGGFGYRQAYAFNFRVGPYNYFGAYRFGFGYTYPIYPAWYYTPAPAYWNPWPVQQPIVIQNIIQAGAAVPVANGRPPVIPAEFEAPAKPAPKPPPKAAKPPPPPVIVPDLPKADRALGRADADRLAESGSKAFANGQYGRALELFRKAADITPNEPSAHYLVSQALFALGKYREAVAAIAVGVKLRDDWSEARFKSRNLYWKKPEAFDDHLKALRQAVAEFPQDASLLFLLGHQLWFDGKQDEARKLIEKARVIGKDQTPAGAFGVNGG